MVSRCGFSVEDRQLVQHNVQIEWDLGFDRQAKVAYIDRIKEALGSGYNSIEDVTTASSDEMGRSCSPFFMYSSEGESLEQVWEDIVKQNIGVNRTPGTFDYLYLNWLSDNQKHWVEVTDCFVDVFHNPEKAMNTQAKALAVYKLLIAQNKEELLTDLKGFITWYSENCVKGIVVKG